jgi:hypothetical protein
MIYHMSYAKFVQKCGVVVDGIPYRLTRMLTDHSKIDSNITFIPIFYVFYVIVGSTEDIRQANNEPISVAAALLLGGSPVKGRN